MQFELANLQSQPRNLNLSKPYHDIPERCAWVDSPGNSLGDSSMRGWDSGFV